MLLRACIMIDAFNYINQMYYIVEKTWLDVEIHVTSGMGWLYLNI